MSRIFGLRPSWQRILCATSLAAGITFYSFVLEPSGVSVFLGAVGVLLGAAALFGVPVQTASGVSFAAAYLAALLSSGVLLDPGAPLIGLLLFGLNESLHHDGTVPDRVFPDARRTRIWSLGGIAGAGFAFGSVLLVVASSVRVPGPAAVAAGGLIAVLLLGSILWATKPLLADANLDGQDR